MRQFTSFLLILITSCLYGQGGSGELISNSFVHDDSVRTYLVYVPSTYDGSQAWPLVINMHGLGSNRFEQQFVSRMNEVADTAHFLIAYPQGTLGMLPNGSMAPAWNPELLPGRADDVGFISQLIDTLAQNWNVDVNRIYSTGMSQGGVMSYILACNIPDRLAAIASVAGVSVLGIDWTCTAGRPMPVLHIHGTADRISPFNGGTGILGPGLVFPPIRDQLGYWLAGNGCVADSLLTSFADLNVADNSTATLRQFQSCDTYVGEDGVEHNAELWFYIIENGGHTWPDAPPQSVPPGLEAIFGNINRDINAGSEIWNFFKRHTLPAAPNPVDYLDARKIGLRVFPNPFTTELNFTFELPSSSRVELGLYNVLGQELARIADLQLPAGEHLLPWRAEAGALVPGLYYYRLRINDEWLSRPVVLGR
ncbi:MAG: PHB depolymerase family esterase [Saprospiraceae bacterium]